jgi:sigma-B regulation protein RsbQ
MEGCMTILDRNNVCVSGQGARPIVFAHGYGCDQVMWRLVAPDFEQDYKVVLFDYVGAGRSDLHAYNPVRYSTLAGYAKDIVEIGEALDLHDAILVGHSVSSMICLLASLDMAERVTQLVMVCPSPRYINDPSGYHGGFEAADVEGLLDMIGRNQPGWANYLAGVVMKNPDQPALSAELEASFCAMDPAIAKRFAEATFLSDNRSDLPRCKTPTLILQCANDSVAPADVVNYVHLSILDSVLVSLQATGHCPQMSHPQETIAAIKANLKAP